MTNEAMFSLLRVFGLTLLLPIGGHLTIYLFGRSLKDNVTVRWILNVLLLAAWSVPFVLGAALIGSFIDKRWVAVLFLMVAALPFYLGYLRRS